MVALGGCVTFSHGTERTVEQKIFDIMQVSLAPTALALESAVNGLQEAVRVGSSEIADDPAVELLQAIAGSLVGSVIQLAKEVDGLE